MQYRKVIDSPLLLTAIVLMVALIFSVMIREFTKPPEFEDGSVVTVKIDQAKVKADVAVSREKLATGLADTPSLPPDEGLLFVYEKPMIPSYWMKGVEYPIDIIWISGGTVTEVTARVAPAKPGSADADLPRYKPDGPVDKVIEVPAGWAAENNVQPGDPVKFSR